MPSLLEFVCGRARSMRISAALKTGARAQLRKSTFGPQADIAVTNAQASVTDHDIHAIAIRDISKLRVHVTREPDVFCSAETETIPRLLTSPCKDWQKREAVTLARAQLLPLRSKLVRYRFEKPISDNRRIIESGFEKS